MKLSRLTLRGWGRAALLTFLSASLTNGRLHAEEANTRAIAISQPTANQPPSPSAPRLPETRVEAAPTPTTEPQPNPDPPQNLPQNQPQSPFSGTFYDSPFASSPVNGYGAPSITTGTIANTPILSVPQSVGVVSQALLQDQQTFSVSNAFRNVSGVVSDHTTGNLGASAAEFNYLMRGFPSTYRRWNGYRSDLIQTTIDTTNIERIEFVKGPSSVLYGASDASGFLNVITKKPLAEDFSRMSVSTGHWGLARTDFDVNRVLTENVGFRLNIGLQQMDSFRNFQNDDRTVIAPTMSFQLTENTRLLVEGEYFSNSTKYDWGIAALGGNLNALPADRWLMGPTDRTFGDYYKSSGTLLHEFNENWAAQIGYSWSSTAQTVETHSPNDLIFGQVLQVPAKQVTTGRLPTLVANVTGEFETGPITHHLTTGGEFEWIDTFTNTQFFFADAIFLDPTNPTYPTSFPTAGGVGSLIDTSIQAQIWSFQDRMELNEFVEFVGGVSYQNFDRTSVGGFGGPVTIKDNNHGWTPKASVILHPLPDFASVWYSYSESMFVQNPILTDITGTPLSPTQGRQNEIGLRVTPTERWWASMAIFDLTKTSVPIFVPPFATAVPVNGKSQGIEFDLYGQLTNRLALTANYAYIDSRVTQDPAALGLLGKQLPLVPRNSANVWAKYTLSDLVVGGVRRSVGVGSGLRWISNRQSLTFPTFLAGGEQTLPGYVTWDAGIYSNYGRAFANLYLENITDKRYYTSGIGSFISPGNPFTIRATIGTTF